MRRRSSLRSLGVVALGGLLGCATSQGQLHRKAQRTLAREDPRGLGSPELARDANPYVRVEALRRMEKRAAQVDAADTAAAAAALDDDTQVFDESCRGIIDAPWGQGPLQGSGYIPGAHCRQAADTPGVHAAKLLRAAPAERVVRAIVARAAAIHQPVLTSAARDILRARGPEASAALLDAVASALPGAEPRSAAALLHAAAFITPGGASPTAVAVVTRAASVPDARVQARAHAALLRITDRAGPEPEPWIAEPRATAVSALAAQIEREHRAGDRSQAVYALADIGPSAAPLLDALLAVLQTYTSEVLEAVKAIGPRARRASDTLIRYDRSVFSLRSYEDVEPYHARILDALVAIDAPAADIEATARRHLGRSMKLWQSALAALLAVRAKVSAEELDQWDETHDAECPNGRMVRMGPESLEECMQVAETLAALRHANGLAQRR